MRQTLLSVLLVAALLGCSSVTDKTLDKNRVTQRDLDALLAHRQYSLEEFKHALGLESDEDKIMEGSSVASLTYRFSAGKRFLFIEANPGEENRVTRAFLVDKQPSPGVREESGVNEVKKPK